MGTKNGKQKFFKLDKMEILKRVKALVRALDIKIYKVVGRIVFCLKTLEVLYVSSIWFTLI